MAVDSVNVTITGKYGPGQTATATLFTGVVAINYLVNQGIIRLMLANQKFIDFEYSPITTVTHTITSHVGTVTIS